MSSGKKLVNEPTDVVTEMIEGLTETYPNLQYLDGFPEVKVVLRSDVRQGSFNKVALISGGGSGHEPAHAGFVGPGMLTAAVCGEIFASPSANAVLAAIRAVTGPPGCLLIVKNYTGDRLNFGLAAEQAKAEGHKVEMVVVGDDCALGPTRGTAGRRGLAGTLFVHKVAGAAAEAGLSLTEVASEAAQVASSVGTMGVGLTVGIAPGGTPSERLGPNKMEIGLGIHGEPGAAVADLKTSDKVVSLLLKQILNPELNYIPVKLGSRVALLVNSLGSTTSMELSIAAGKAIASLQLNHGLAVERVYMGTLMTSLDMAGISLSVLKVDDLILTRLDAATSAPSWPVGVAGPRPPTTVPIPMPTNPNDEVKGLRRPEHVSPAGELLDAAIRGAADGILQNYEKLNELDRVVGDGDCGSTMRLGALKIKEDLETRYPLNEPIATLREIGVSVEKAMGGTSGILYTIFFRAAVAKLSELSAGSQNCTPANWSSAFASAVSAVEKYGGASRGSRTMLDALLPASETLEQGLSEGIDPWLAFSHAVDAARIGAESTKAMVAQAGRSSYVPLDILQTVPDPGAMAVTCWLDGIIAHTTKLRD